MVSYTVTVIYSYGVAVVCWLIRRKARVRTPGQTSKQNTKSIFSAIFFQQISGKNSESKIKLPWKVSQKTSRSDSILNINPPLMNKINTYNISGVRN